MSDIKIQKAKRVFAEFQTRGRTRIVVRINLGNYFPLDKIGKVEPLLKAEVEQLTSEIKALGAFEVVGDRPPSLEVAGQYLMAETLILVTPNIEMGDLKKIAVRL